MIDDGMNYCDCHEIKYDEEVGCPYCITNAGLVFIEDHVERHPQDKGVVDEFMGMLKALEGSKLPLCTEARRRPWK